MNKSIHNFRIQGHFIYFICSKKIIPANKNTVPFDPESPFVTSGLRLGSPAMTTRGMGAVEFSEIGNIIADYLLNPEDETVKQDSLARVAKLCQSFPLYPHLQMPIPVLA